MKWRSLFRELAPSNELSLRIDERLAECRASLAAVCLKPDDAGGPSPLARLARLWNREPDLDEYDLRSRFAKDLSDLREAETGQPYQAQINRIAGRAEEDIHCLLTDDQAEQLRTIGIGAMLESDDDSDPMGERLCELMAGLPPVNASAETNVGLPEPEDHGNKFSGLFCSQPFEYAQVDPLGQMYLCCPQTLPVPAGDLGERDFMSVWNSEKARAIRQSILDGSFRHCSEATCGVLQNRKLPRKEEVTNPYHREIIDRGLTRLERGPGVINLSYDRTCNLACPSCRSDFIVLRGKARSRAETIHKRVTGSHLKDARRLIITGSGDPFGSKLYFSFLREFDPRSASGIRIQLSTNGLLFTPDNWNRICGEAVDRVDVSVDGASQETYGLNRGGDFAALVANLEFIGTLRQSEQLRSFELHYVVQANNYREMKEFVALGETVQADRVCFKQLVNWGTYSERDYLDRAVHLPGHPEHGLFLDQLTDPVFARPLVYLHDLSHLAKLRTARIEDRPRATATEIGAL